MYAVFHLIRLVLGFLRLGITPIKPGATAIAPAVAGQAGALTDAGGVTNVLSALSNNGAPAFGNWSQTLIPAIGAATITGGQLVGGILRRFAPGSTAFTDCTDTATNILLAIPGAVVNQTFPVIIGNLGSGANTMTLAGGTGVTIAGTATIGGNAFRLFIGQVTGSAAVTLTNCFQWSANPVGAVTTGL